MFACFFGYVLGPLDIFVLDRLKIFLPCDWSAILQRPDCHSSMKHIECGGFAKWPLQYCNIDVNCTCCTCTLGQKMAQEVLIHQYRCAIKLHWLHCNRKSNANIIQYALLYRTIALTTVYDEMYPMVGRGLFYAGKPLAPVFQCHVLGLAWLVPPQSMFLHNKCPIWPQYPCFRLLCRRTHKCPQPLLSGLWPVSPVTILAGGLHQSLDELSIVVSRCHVCPEEQRVSSVFVVAQVDLDRDKSCWHSSHRGKVFVSGWRLHCGAVFNRFL